MQLAPVSYTHLRAHETVLDLVCRLLLEKKKNNHVYIIILINNETVLVIGCCIMFDEITQHTNIH